MKIIGRRETPMKFHVIYNYLIQMLMIHITNIEISIILNVEMNRRKNAQKFELLADDRLRL